MSTKKFDFMKPTEDNSVIEAHEKYLEEAKNASYNMFRFYIKPGEDAQITFLDGEISDDGILICPKIREHQIYKDGTVKVNTCTNMAGEPCPICEDGDNPTAVAFLTVIDHSSYQGKNKVYKDTRKIFAMKTTTFKMLSKKAIKYGGLTGCTFDVSRTAKTDPSVGNDFDYIGKLSLEEITKAYPETFNTQKSNDVYKKFKTIVPADYSYEVPYHTREELIALGEATGAGSVSGDTIHKNEGSTTDYSGEI